MLVGFLRYIADASPRLVSEYLIGSSFL